APSSTASSRSAADPSGASARSSGCSRPRSPAACRDAHSSSTSPTSSPPASEATPSPHSPNSRDLNAYLFVAPHARAPPIPAPRTCPGGPIPNFCGGSGSWLEHADRRSRSPSVKRKVPREGRPLRRLGRARALRGRDASRIQVIALIGTRGRPHITMTPAPATSTQPFHWATWPHSNDLRLLESVVLGGHSD